MSMTKEREERIRMVALNRQTDLTVVLENVHDPHNIAAVLRTCDSVGIREVYMLNNTPELVKAQVIVGKNAASGARKWVKLHVYTDTAECFAALKEAGYTKMYGTHLSNDAVSLYEMNLIEPLALVFGNEREGITEKTLPYLDGNFVIPQVGMVKSLNISVACAVSLYEAYRQRLVKGHYNGKMMDDATFEEIQRDLVDRHERAYKGRSHEPI